MTRDDTTTDQLDAVFVDFFKALANTERLRVAAAIADGPRTASEVAAALVLPVRAVINHLGTLTASGFALVEGVGTNARYTWNESRVRGIAAEHLESPRARALAGATDERSRVLAAFIRDGRLERFPASEARKQVILEHIAERFAAGRTYTEKEVNGILKEFADDYTTIRRALVDRVFLNRANGVYWVGESRRSGSSTGTGVRPDVRE